jgi:hypothetical protein
MVSGWNAPLLANGYLVVASAFLNWKYASYKNKQQLPVQILCTTHSFLYSGNVTIGIINHND